MARKIINTGSTPNDGTGDNLRVALGKVNDNFNELYGTVDTVGTTANAAQTTANAATPQARFNRLWVTNIAELTALTNPTDGEIVVTKGYYLANDGGGGSYIWVAASTGTPNYGTYFLKDGQTTATAGRWERIITGSSIDCRWFGIMGYGLTDESARFQDLVNYIIPSTTRQREITIPSNCNILLASPIIIGTQAATAIGWSFTSHITISGANRALGSGGARFTLSGTNQVGFCVQYVRCVTFRNFSIEGRNNFGGAAADLDARHTESNYINAAASVREDRYSPHAGVIIDPFSSEVPEVNRYPGLEAYYAGNITGGSSRVKFEGVNFQWFTVCAVVSLAIDALNAEEVDFLNCTFTASKVGVAFGQSQTRANTVEKCRFAGLHTAITTTRYGKGTGSMPLVTGGDFVVLNQLFESSSSSGGFLIQGVYAEDFLRIGHDTGGSKPIQMAFVGCDFHIAGGYVAPEYHWYSITPVTFKGCNFQNNGTFPFIFYGGDRNTTLSPIMFDDCNFFHLAENNLGVHREFIVSNSELPNGSSNQTMQRLAFRNSRVFKANSKSVTIDSQQIYTPTIANMNGKMVIPGSTIVSGGVVYRISDTPAPSSGHVITNPSLVFGSGGGTFETTTTNRFRVGDAVRVGPGQTWPQGPVDNFANLYIGYVTEVSGNTVTLAGVPYSVPANFAVGTTVFDVTWIPRFHEPTTGDVTSGSAVITNVSPNPTNVWSVGDRISGTGIPAGSYVTAVTSSTITICANATATNTGVSLYDAIYSKVIAETSIDTSAKLAAIVSDETGTGSLVFSTSPALTTPTVTGAIGLNGDAFLLRDAANVTALRNGTSANTFRVYNTYTNDSNYERLELRGNGTSFSIDSVAAGTGTVRTLNIGTAGANRLSINSTGVAFQTIPIPSSNLSLDMGSSTFTWRTVYAGGIVLGVATKTSAYTLTVSDHAIRGDTTSGGFTLTLPAAASNTGRVYRIKKISADSNTLTIQANGAELIDGSNTQTITTQHGAIVIQSNGTSWDIVGKYL